jgi:hypothetical protein
VIALYPEHDPVLGWRKKPGARATFRRREYTVEVSINREGLRDPERPAAPARGVFRVLALGDSFVEGYTVPLSQTVTQVLETSLRGKGCRAEAVNGGTAAYGTDQELLFYRMEGVKYAPQVVVLFFYYNDVLLNAQGDHFGTPKPLFAVTGDELVLSNTPLSPPPLRAATEPRPSADDDPGGGSALIRWVRARVGRGAPRAHDVLARTGLWEPLRPTPPSDALKVYKRRRVPEVDEAWDLTTRILQTLDAEVQARGAHFLAVYVPSRMEVRDGDWVLTVRQHALEEDQWDRGRVASRLAEIGREAGFPVLDLTPALRRAERGVLGGPYFVHDGHWNALGHGVAAAEVEREMKERGWVPACGP